MIKDFISQADSYKNTTENNNYVREKVLDSYQDIKAGKGRDYKEFFAELEQKYQK